MMIFYQVYEWLKDSYIELAGTLLSLICLFFSVRQNILLWHFGILSSAIYVYIYFIGKIYADMALNMYYIFISIYGWIVWAGSTSANECIRITRISKIQAIYLTVIGTIILSVLSIVLKKYTDSPVPFIDAFTTAASLVATWMLARKILEHWIIWIIVDTLSIGLYLSRELYITILLFITYTTMAIVGYFQWKRQYYMDIYDTNNDFFSRFD